jgi:hypothetical protein
MRDIGPTTQIRIEDVAGCTYPVEREQRDAMSAVLVARALRPLAGEAAARVGLDHLELEAGRDVLQVDISQAGPGDARGHRSGWHGSAVAGEAHCRRRPGGLARHAELDVDVGEVTLDRSDT